MGKLIIFASKENRIHMFNPAVTSGVDLFVYIVIGLISFAAALTVIDIKKENSADHNE